MSGADKLVANIAEAGEYILNKKKGINMSKVSKILEQEIEKHRLSRQGLARAAGLSDGIVTKIMNDNLKISVDVCARIAIALSIDPFYLLQARIDDEMKELAMRLNEGHEDVRKV